MLKNDGAAMESRCSIILLFCVCKRGCSSEDGIRLVPAAHGLLLCCFVAQELLEKKIPFTIRRFLPDGSYEDWNVDELIIPETR